MLLFFININKYLKETLFENKFHLEKLNLYTKNIKHLAYFLKFHINKIDTEKNTYIFNLINKKIF